MMVEYGEQFWETLGAALRCPRRQPAGRHALAALRHVRDGRAPPGRDRAGRRARSAGPTRGTLGFALVYLGEHYVVDLLAGAGAGRGRPRAAAPAAPRRSRGACRAVRAGARGAGARMSDAAPAADRATSAPSARRDDAGRGDAAGR